MEIPIYGLSCVLSKVILLIWDCYVTNPMVDRWKNSSLIFSRRSVSPDFTAVNCWSLLSLELFWHVRPTITFKPYLWSCHQFNAILSTAYNEVSGIFIASLAVSVSIESNIEDFTSAQVLGVEEGSRSSDHLVPISEEGRKTIYMKMLWRLHLPMSIWMDCRYHGRLLVCTLDQDIQWTSLLVWSETNAVFHLL